MYGLIGKIIAQPGQRDALLKILLEGVSGMPGCLSYVVAHDQSNADALWITEVWESQASHSASLTLPAVNEAIAQGRPLIAGFGERFETEPVGGQGITPHGQRSDGIVTLGYVSLYLKDLQPAITFYSQVFGAPDSVDETSQIYGWHMGTTWLTLLPSSASSYPESNPRNTEFAIQVTTPAEVDLLYQALLAAGAKACMAPADTKMYEPMRFACVDDPFGVRIDVYCPFYEQNLPYL